MLRVARVTTVLGAASIAFAASCFLKPDEPHLTGDARTDGMGTGTDGMGTGTDVDAPAAPTCSGQGVWDNFDNSNGNPCGTWGTGFGSASVPIVRTGGKLKVSPNNMGNVYCQTNSAIPIQNGISIEIPQIATVSSGHVGTFFRVRPATTGTDSFEVHINSGVPSMMSMLYCNGTQLGMLPFTYNASAHRWWKFELHPTFVNQVIHIYSSGDASSTSWADMYTCTWTSSGTSVFVELGVEGMPGTSDAFFDNFNVKTCPP
ncbi:MAG TPA: hypothetical protein VL326_24895 [Kofleriaceae bacterium]|nr:hypothetical protein [Kofleriaceae bacterium]